MGEYGVAQLWHLPEVITGIKDARECLLFHGMEQWADRISAALGDNVVSLDRSRDKPA